MLRKSAGQESDFARGFGELRHGLDVRCLPNFYDQAHVIKDRVSYKIGCEQSNVLWWQMVAGVFSFSDVDHRNPRFYCIAHGISRFAARENLRADAIRRPIQQMLKFTADYEKEHGKIELPKE
jgi:hypothetical protein